MKARFRVRQEQGDLEIESLQEFERRVRSGAIAESDLVHDALTGEWAPARAHPVYHLVQESFREAREARRATRDAGASREADVASAPEAPAEDDLGLAMELVEPEDASPEEKAEAFIEQMERERRDDPDHSELGSDVELFDGRTASSLASSPGPDSRESSTFARATHGGRPDVGPPRRGAPFRTDVGDLDADARVRGSPAGRSRHALGILGVALLVLGVTAAVARPAFRFQDTLPPSARAEDAAEPRAAPRSDSELRVEAQDAFLDRVDSLRASFELGRVPEDWLEGRYLAEASAHPEVGRFWTDYLRYVEQVYADEVALYRDAYLSVLDQAGMEGPMRSLRLARATGDFQARAGERHQLYAQVWELAVAARSLHQLLVELEGNITWEPARGERLSADPVTEAAGGDPETQARLDEALDRVLEALYLVAEGGRDVKGREPDWLARRLAEAPLS